MSSYRIDAETKYKIIQLKNDGLSVKDIADELGIAVSIMAMNAKNIIVLKLLQFLLLRL